MKKKKITLKDLRVQLRLSQPEFANELGLSLSIVQKYEQGKRNPSLKTIRLIETKYGVTLV